MSQPRILAVDDDENQLTALKRSLRRSNFTVDTATSGRAGLRMVMRNPPDLILLDVAMPCMSGHEFLRRFRRLESRGYLTKGNDCQTGVTRKIPVIFLTGLDTPHQCVSGLDAGAVDYVTKPFDPDELRARIRGQLRREREHAEMQASTESELTRMEFCITAALEAASECQEQLRHLEACLVQADTDYAERRLNLVVRARGDIQDLTQSLSSIAEWFATKETD